MIKKVFVLMLVFITASFAQAGLELAISPDGDYSTYTPGLVDSEIWLALGETAWIGIYNNVAGASAAKTMWVALDMFDPGSWTGGNIVYGAPNPGYGLNTYHGLGAVYGWDMWLFEPDVSPGEYPVGPLAGYEFQCDGAGDVQIFMLDESLNSVDSIIIHQVPEPMTMALLGLGGLFLYRRK